MYFNCVSNKSVIWLLVILINKVRQVFHSYHLLLTVIPLTAIPSNGLCVPHYKHLSEGDWMKLRCTVSGALYSYIPLSRWYFCSHRRWWKFSRFTLLMSSNDCLPGEALDTNISRSSRSYLFFHCMTPAGGVKIKLQRMNYGKL